MKIDRKKMEWERAGSRSDRRDMDHTKRTRSKEKDSMASIKNSNGFSLVETIVVIAIVAIMGTFAVPPMISWLQNKGLNSAARDLYSNMRKAQSIAVKNNRNCVISFDGSNGYIVYVDENKNKIFDSVAVPPAKADTILSKVSWSQYRNVQYVSANFFDGTKIINFPPNLIPSTNGTVTLTNLSSRKLAIVISVGGNISLH